MPHLPQDTIAAPASAAGSALRSIVRLSGPHSGQLLRQLLPHESLQPSDQARRIQAQLALPDWPPLPVAVLTWPTRRSFTGEPLAELHFIGATPIVQAVLEAIYQLGGRPAEPGEFTQRAFLNGRIDLLQAEAVLGVIDANSQGQLQTALAQLAGGISTAMRELRNELLLHLADLEAGLDFVEEDIEFVHREQLLQRLQTAVNWLSELRDQSASRMVLSGRPRVVLAGLPNAGKSTLFNALTQSATAIVSPLAGTTRDYLEQTVLWQSMELDLVDTAGWERESPQQLLMAMDAQRGEQYRRADLLIWCSAANQQPSELAFNAERLSSCRELGIPVLHLLTKSDLGIELKNIPSEVTLHVSARSRAGVLALQAAVVSRLQELSPEQSLLLGATSARCQHALQSALDSAERAFDLTTQHAGDELIAFELRTVLDQLGEIVGAIYTDDILDRIFSRFCIGK